jgi:flagellar assembly factor FliW
VSEIELSGRTLGFEEYEKYLLRDDFGEVSPFRILSCVDEQISFVVINPFHVLEDYSFEIDDQTAGDLGLEKGSLEKVAVLCIVRPQENTLYVNLRSPLVINTKDGLFKQVILENESYPVSFPFAVKNSP